MIEEFITYKDLNNSGWQLPFERTGEIKVKLNWFRGVLLRTMINEVSRGPSGSGVFWGLGLLKGCLATFFASIFAGNLYYVFDFYLESNPSCSVDRIRLGYVFSFKVIST